MKKSILVLLAIVLLSYPTNLMGADYETPHKFKAGDTISAEMMNEIFTHKTHFIKINKQVLKMIITLTKN